MNLLSSFNQLKEGLGARVSTLAAPSKPETDATRPNTPRLERGQAQISALAKKSAVIPQVAQTAFHQIKEGLGARMAAMAAPPKAVADEQPFRMHVPLHQEALSDAPVAGAAPIPRAAQAAARVAAQTGAHSGAQPTAPATPAAPVAPAQAEAPQPAQTQATPPSGTAKIVGDPAQRAASRAELMTQGAPSAMDADMDTPFSDAAPYDAETSLDLVFSATEGDATCLIESFDPEFETLEVEIQRAPGDTRALVSTDIETWQLVDGTQGANVILRLAATATAPAVSTTLHLVGPRDLDLDKIDVVVVNPTP